MSLQLYLLIVYVSSFLKWFLADRTNGRAYATLLRPSVVCNVMYCGIVGSTVAYRKSYKPIGSRI